MSRYGIVYTSDNNYAHVMGTSLYSLLDHNQLDLDFDIHIISNGISDENKNRIKEIADRFQRNIFFYDLENSLFRLVGNDPLWNITTYARLFIAEILPETVDHILYVDGDTIILRELRYLFELDMRDNNIIYGVLDRYNKGSIERLGLKEKVYVNSGIMLMNLKIWREKGIPDQVRLHLKERKWKFADQDILNFELNGHIGILPMEYNMYMFSRKMPYEQAIKLSFDGIEQFYTKKDYEYAQKNTAIVHFAGSLFNRPWQKNSRQTDHEYFDMYYSKTPWSDMPYTKRKYTSKVSTSIYFYFCEKILWNSWKKRDYEKFVRQYCFVNELPLKVKGILRRI